MYKGDRKEINGISYIKREVMDGVIIIDKPKGMTSHDIVSAVRKIYKTRRVGHTGTLDPMATGVLPVCVGNATKAADMLTSADKKYSAVMRLGSRTDTLDADGTVTEEKDVNVAEQDIYSVISEFVGEQDQIPPMYSAIKQNGRKLYELAREGIEVERKPRRVTIFSIEIKKIDLPYISIDVHCSKGTYIRSLCDDIGQRLGCGAVMTELRRTETAGFSIDESHTIDQLSAAEDPCIYLIKTDELFRGYEAIRLNEKQERSIINGVRMTWRNGTDGNMYRLYGHDGRFLCISQLKDSRLVLVKSFWS